MNLESIMLSVVSPKRKTNTEWSHLYVESKKHQTHWNKKSLDCCGDRGWEVWEMDESGQRI